MKYSKNALRAALVSVAFIGATSAIAEDRPYGNVVNPDEFSPEVLLNQNWKQKPKNMTVIDVPGVAGSIIMLRNGLGDDGSIVPELQYETSNLPQESYKTELLDEVIFDRMINVSNTSGLSATHPIFSFGVDLSDTDMVRVTVKRTFRKTAPSLSDDKAYAALRVMAERNFSGDPKEPFHWVKAVELRTVSIQTFKEVKKAGNAGLFFFSGKKTYQFVDKTNAVKEFIGVDLLTKSLEQIRVGANSGSEESGEIEVKYPLDAVVPVVFAADIPFSRSIK